MSSDKSPRRERYTASIGRALEWLAAHQGADGSFGIEFERGVNPIMVMPLTYLWGGMPRRCGATIERIRSAYVAADGSLNRPAKETSQSDQYQQPYALSWVVRSAAACEAHDLAHRCARQLLPYQHAGSGGFFGTPQEAQRGEGVIDMASTGMAGLALAATGRFDAARAAGDYLLAWLGRQRDMPERMIAQWHTAKGPVNDPSQSDRPANGNAPLVVARSRPHTDYWLCGIIVAFLVELHQVTGEASYRDAACRVFDFAAGSPELGNVCAAHKFAWAAARLYSISKDPAHLEAGCRVADRLARAQRPDGYFVHEDLVKPDEQPHAINVNVTSQFVTWMEAVAMQL